MKRPLQGEDPSNKIPTDRADPVKLPSIPAEMSSKSREPDLAIGLGRANSSPCLTKGRGCLDPQPLSLQEDPDFLAGSSWCFRGPKLKL